MLILRSTSPLIAMLRNVTSYSAYKIEIDCKGINSLMSPVTSIYELGWVVGVTVAGVPQFIMSDTAIIFIGTVTHMVAIVVAFKH